MMASLTHLARESDCSNRFFVHVNLITLLYYWIYPMSIFIEQRTDFQR